MFVFGHQTSNYFVTQAILYTPRDTMKVGVGVGVEVGVDPMKLGVVGVGVGVG